MLATPGKVCSEGRDEQYTLGQFQTGHEDVSQAVVAVSHKLDVVSRLQQRLLQTTDLADGDSKLEHFDHV